jgi:drug/metabolite transporter (DMT)-like permease
LIGDWAWLQGLKVLGARRVILMDSFKPFLAAALGWMVLGEDLELPAFIGIALTVAGVLGVSLERTSDACGNKLDIEPRHSVEIASLGPPKEHGDADADANENNGLPAIDSAITRVLQSDIILQPKATIRKDTTNSSDLKWGYVMSLINVVLDTYGSLLTKKYGVGMTVWEINMLRFGFAGVAMLVLSALMHAGVAVTAALFRSRSSTTGSSTMDTGTCRLSLSSPPSVERCNEEKEDECSCDKKNDKNSYDAGVSNNTIVDQKQYPTDPGETKPAPWYALPSPNSMTRLAWCHVAGGVFLVTFLTPTLSNYSLFQIALALALTLGSVGPLYALPLAYLMQNQIPTARAAVGAVLAVAGIAILAFWGKTNGSGDTSNG